MESVCGSVVNLDLGEVEWKGVCMESTWKERVLKGIQSAPSELHHGLDEGL